MPRKDKHHNESIEYFGELRDLTRFKEDHWQLKISVPEITIYDNLWLTLSEEEIDFLEQEIKRYRGSKNSVYPSKTHDGSSR